MNWFDSLLTVYTKSCILGLMSPKGNKRPEWDRQRIQALRRHLGLTQRQMADELGTRNYEMYSGGEAFRIDLALRIALSMLLVRRAGASLPILIIDEGFGTQDGPAREKLVEAISSIQNDFEKIFVITHLEEMKDRFPVLINVTKTADGSMISIR
jgi:DNA repair exonuclease SbcCD ATPase subunit